MFKFVLEKPERFSWPLWIGALTVGALVIGGLAALGIVLALVIVSIGMAVVIIAGLVTVLRQTLDSWQTGKGLQPNGEEEEVLMEVEEIVTIPPANRGDSTRPGQSDV